MFPASLAWHLGSCRVAEIRRWSHKDSEDLSIKHPDGGAFYIKMSSVVTWSPWSLITRGAIGAHSG